MRISRNKYRAIPTEFQGERYDSKAEAAYASQLEMLRKAGKVVRWERGKVQTLIEGPTRALRVTYKPDFLVFYPDGRREAVDVKGVVGREFRVKALLWAERFPNLPLRVVDSQGRVKWPKPRPRDKRKAA